MKKPFLILSLMLFSWNVWAQNHSSCSKISTKDLEQIGKVWGFLKYHHPAVTSGSYDWDQELFLIIDHVVTNPDSLTLNSILEKWIDTLGPITTIKYKARYLPEDIKLLPDNGWIRDTVQLGATLSAKLVRIELAKRPKELFYFYDEAKEGIATPANEKTYKDVDLDENYRLLSLFRFWNIIQYFYPYKYAIGEDWSEVMVKYIPQMIRPQTKKEFILTLMKLNSDVNDAHIVIKNQDWVFGKNSLPYMLSVIENKIIVTDYYDKALCDSSGIRIGDEILEINGKSMSKLLNDLSPYCSGVNMPTKLRIACDKLELTDLSVIPVKIANVKGEFIKEVICNSSEKIERKLKYQSNRDPIKIENNIAHVYLGSLTIEGLDKRLPEILSTSGMILDFRGYPIDNAIYDLLDYLLPKEKTKFYQTTIPDIARPGCIYFQEENPSHFIFSELEKVKPYSGKVVVLVDERTQSEAELCTMMASVIHDVAILGSQTAATDGPAIPLFLPGEILTRFTGVGIYNPDRSETQRVGLKLTQVIHQTVEGVRNGVDPLVQRAIELIFKK